MSVDSKDSVDFVDPKDPKDPKDAKDAKEWIAKLERIYNLSHDAVAVYDVAADLLENRRVRDKLEEYNQANKEHVEAIERFSMKVNGTKPQRSPTSEGISNAAISYMLDSPNDTRILKVLRRLERLIHESYIEALRFLGNSSDGEDEKKLAAKLLNHNLSQKHGHFVYVKEALSYPRFFEEQANEKRL